MDQSDLDIRLGDVEETVNGIKYQLLLTYLESAYSLIWRGNRGIVLAIL